MPQLIETTFFRLTLFKRAIGNPSYVWRNVYELRTIEPISSLSTFSEFVGEVAALEAEIHGNNVEYVKGILSSWEPQEDDVYDPGEFVTVPLEGLLGQKSYNGEALGRNLTLFARKGVPVGRAGKAFYRGTLGETDLQGGTSLDARVSSAATTTYNGLLLTFLADFNGHVEAIDGNAGGGMTLLRLNASSAIEWRDVQSLVVGGVSFVKPDHKYYDLA